MIPETIQEQERSGQIQKSEMQNVTSMAKDYRLAMVIHWADETCRPNAM